MVDTNDEMHNNWHPQSVESVSPQTSVTTPSSPPPRTGHRINPDDRRFIVLVTVGVIAAGLVAFAISFVALMEVASWLGLPRWMHWAIPAFIDVAILVYAASVLVHKARGEPTWKSWIMLGSFTMLSVVANIAHALSHEQQTEWQSIIAATIAGMVPFAIFAATEQLASVAVEDPGTRTREYELHHAWLDDQEHLEAERIERECRQVERQAEMAVRKARAQARAQAILTGDLPTDIRNVNGGKGPPPKRLRNNGNDPAPVDKVLAYVEKRTSVGKDTTAADVAEWFSCSKDAASRRLDTIYRLRPEAFIEEVSKGTGSGH